jgi:hypothetical protein
VVVCEIAEPCGVVEDLIFAGLFVLANSQSRRLVTARCQCAVIDLDSGVDAAIGFVTGVGTGTDWTSAYNAAMRNAGANASMQYPGRRVRVKHCRPA